MCEVCACVRLCVCEVCACVRCVRGLGVCKYVCNNFNSRQLKMHEATPAQYKMLGGALISSRISVVHIWRQSQMAPFITVLE